MDWSTKTGNFNPILFYRYQDSLFRDGVHVQLIVYVFEKETRCGWWITPHLRWMRNLRPTLQRVVDTNKRWVSKTALKRHAYPDKEQALKNFVFRKRKQVAILKDRLSDAQHALELGKMLMDGKEPMLKHRLYGDI